MKNASSEFIFSGAIKIAWLIRSDVRAGLQAGDIEGQKDFLAWWVCFGQKEYPHTEPLNDRLKTILFAPLDDYPSCHGFGVNRLLLKLYEDRQDVNTTFNLATLENILSLNGWFYLYGLKEVVGENFLDKQAIGLLNQPLSEFLPSVSRNQDVLLSPLMYFLWIERKDLKETFDINYDIGRRKFLGWFFLQGVQELSLANLISDDWLQWLNNRIYTINQKSIGRIAKLCWDFREDINDAFDIETETGISGLNNWAEQNLLNEFQIDWIDKTNNERNKKIGVNLIGFAFGELGIGEDVRMAALACEKVGIPYNVVNIPAGKLVRQEDFMLKDAITDQLESIQYSINIFCLTGFDTAHVYLEKGRQLFENRYNIGWWPWELPVWPQSWECAFDLIDEVWAATSFTQCMYQQVTEKPLTLMPLPADVSRVFELKREELGFHEDDILFLYVFDFNSYIERKNPFATVKAFIEAFSEESANVRLILKTMNSNESNPIWRKFKKLCDTDKRIRIIDETMDRGRVLGLIQACDIYISLHRSEGFGRTLAEAMLFGKPVVATNFSGNVDFLNEETGFPVSWRKKKVKVGQYPFITEQCGAYWAEPIISNASQQLRRAMDSLNNADSKDRIKTYAESQFSAIRIGQLIKARLQAIS